MTADGDALCLRVLWSDWRRTEPAEFDLLEILSFCQTLPSGWSVRILNATGRIGGQLPSGADPHVAAVEFRFPDAASLLLFRSHFDHITVPRSSDSI